MGKTTKTTKATITASAGLRYIGANGDHISGIPARDLTPSEVANLSDEQVTACLESKLYEVNNE